MYDSLIKIFHSILDTIVYPLKGALTDTGIFNPLINFINGLLENIMRFKNDNNNLKVILSNEIISYVIGLIVLVIIIEIIYALFKIVFKAFEAIQSNINSFDNKQRWKKRGGHKKK